MSIYIYTPTLMHTHTPRNTQTYDQSIAFLILTRSEINVKVEQSMRTGVKSENKT